MDQQSKKSARAAVREARKNLPDTVRTERAGQIGTHVREYLAALTPVVRSVALYNSQPDEPDTETLMRQLFEDGINVYLPVCEPEYQLSWVRWEPGIELERSPRAPVMEPVGQRFGVEPFEAEDGISTLFIPALSIDANGYRLGQGGGYYDRFLPRIAHTPVQVAAMVFDEEFVPAGSYELNEYDTAVDLVITPAGVHHIID